MCRISVIVISYNEREYIEKCVKSILTQNLGNNEMEIIIGDDGSTDGSIEIINQIVDNLNFTDNTNIYFKSYVMDRIENEPIIPSIRVSNNLKRGIDVATGDYVACISADDSFCDNESFINAIDFLENNKKYISVASGYRTTGAFTKNYCYQNLKSGLLYWSYPYLHVSCFVFRKISSELLLNRLCDDIGLEYSLVKHGKIKFEINISFEYFQRKGSIMHESDNVERSILDMMLYQDIMNDNCGFLIGCATRSRLYGSMKKCFLERKKINDEKYNKFVTNSDKYPNNYLRCFISYDDSAFPQKIGLKVLLFRSFIDRVIFKTIRKIRRIQLV